MRDRNNQANILEGLQSVNEAKNEKYIDIEDIKSNSKVRDFFAVERGLVDDFYDFMKSWDKASREHYERDLKGLEYNPPKFTVGKNYIKTVFHGAVSSFIDRYGNVYKPASWAAPAKGVRYYLDDYRDIKFDSYGSFLYGNRNLEPRNAEFYR